jgi:hypothetical protein
LLLLYLAIEGLLRFFAGAATGEPLPNLGVALAFRIAKLRTADKGWKQHAALLPDFVEALPDGRIRIASARPRGHWTSSLTIGLEGRWFEVERAEAGRPPRGHVYLLRPAPAGKVLRGYEEYDAASALRSGPAAAAPPDEK